MSQLFVDDDFDNGRIEVVDIDQELRRLTTRVPDDDHTQDPQMRFWQFRIRGLSPGEPVQICHQPSVDMHYVYSYDRRIWHRFPFRGMSDVTYRFSSSEVFIAPNIAYPYTRSLELASEMSNSPYVRIQNLAISEGGRAVKLFRITEPSVRDEGKRIVWVQGRQHAFESASSLPPEGLIRWIASSDQTAAAFRRQCIVYVVPIMDVDNVYLGKSGKDMPRDFNRCWQETACPWKVIEATCELLLNLKREGESFLGFVDSHSPYFTQGPQWYVASSEKHWEIFRTEFLRQQKKAGCINRHGMEVESFLAGQPEDTVRSRDFAATHLSQADDFLALTLESPHHQDSEGRFMMEWGYLQWGEVLGRTFFAYMTRGERA